MAGKRKQLKVYITEGTLRKFLELMDARTRGTSKHGALSRMVEVALEDYIEAHGTLIPHTQARANPGFPMDSAVCLQIIMNLSKRGITYECPESLIAAAVGELRGSDYRTVQHWIERLIHYRYIGHRPTEPQEDKGFVQLGKPKNPIFRILYHPKE